MAFGTQRWPWRSGRVPAKWGFATRNDVGMPAEADASRDLRVGDPVRSTIGRAALGSTVVAVVFVVMTWAAKELPSLYVREPWQDDPYDTVVSFALWCVPMLVALCTLRVVMCRRDAPLPVRRALDVVRASRVLVAAVALTLASEWSSVLVHAHRAAWTATTTALIWGLLLLTVLTVAVSRALRLAGRATRRFADAPSQPDWLADAIALGERHAQRLGSSRRLALRVLRWLDSELIARIRCYPLRACGVFAVGAGVALASPQVIYEGYSTTVAVFFVAVAGCGMFAIIAIVGSHLRIVERPDAPSSAVSVALVLACASVPLTVAFRDALWALLATDTDGGLAELAELAIGVAMATGAVVLAAVPLARGRRARPRAR